MFMKTNVLAGLAMAVALGPMPVAAGSNNGLLPGIMLGVIGSAIVRDANRNRRSRLPKTSQGRQIQTSLNYFGFPAGAVDGQLGRKSRAAISSYQTYMSFPVTGKLTDYELDFLLSSYQRAMLGGAAITQLVSTNPDGTRGLLRAFRDEMAGGGGATDTGAGITNLVSKDSEGALPDFFNNDEAFSLASQCNKVSLLTNTNGGFTTEVSMSDPAFALSEQFCLARTYAISNGEELARKVQGFTPQQIAQQCDSFGPAMREYVAALSLKPRDTVMQDVGGFVLRTGMSPAQLSGTARICLSVGYRTDNMDVAIGSALLLTVLGEKPYAELLGHHLGLGFGTSKRPDLALAWYEMGLDALEKGAPAVFAPGQDERNALIRRAAYSLDGSGALSGGEQPQPVVLPGFSIKQ
jgi:peptidoglycan hydrolase-like protein with peptidoglycan-binding domain